MPELPEVETIRRGLQKVILNKKITHFESRDSKVVRFEPKKINGQQINNIDRRAKMLIFGLDNGHCLLVHLKMTGQLIWESHLSQNEFQLRNPKENKMRVAGGHPSPAWVEKLPNKHTRAIFYFDDKSVLYFNDLRRFGYLKEYPTDSVMTEKELRKIGVEPFSKDFTVEYLKNRANKVPNRKIKQFITDQEIIAGVGNIYVDESLFMARISPLRKVIDIKKNEWTKILKSIVDALKLGIKYGGSSEETYVDAFGKQGEMNKHVKVYRKTGNKCPNNCGGEIKRIVSGGRGTHYCPKCQK